MRFFASRRQLTLLSVTFVLVLALMLCAILALAATQETRIAKDWMALAERCRTSIEAGIPLNTDGLERAEIIQMPPDTARPLHQRTLSFPGGRYAVKEVEHPVGDGVIRSCSVTITDYRIGPTKREAAVLLYELLQLKSKLFQSETHWDAEVLGGPQIAAHAFEPREPRDDGCTVKNFIFVTLETHDVRMIASEMEGCSGPSFLSGATV